MRRLTMALALAGAVTAVVPAQQPPASPPLGYVVGKIVDAQTNAPLGGVLVQIASTTAQSPGAPRILEPTVLTGADGRFLFRGVPAGTYIVLAGLGGSNGFTPNGFIVSGSGFPIGSYLNGSYGQRRPLGPPQPFGVAENQRVGDLTVRLWKAGVIAGRVIDEAGEPLVGQVVGTVQISSDGRLLTGPTIRTDDRGAYRVSGLVPGTYIVFVPQTQVSMPLSIGDDLAAGGPDPLASQRFSFANAPSARVGGVRVGPSVISTTPDPVRFGSDALISNAIAPTLQADAVFVYPTTFAPTATRLAEAERIALQPGEERAGVNVQLRPSRAASISGVLVDENGPMPNVGLHLMPADMGRDGAVLEAATTASDARGGFSFPAVPAGQYTILAWRTGGVPTGNSAKPYVDSRTGELGGAWARQPVTVGASPIENVTVTMQPPFVVSGRAVFEGVGPQPTAQTLGGGRIVTIFPSQTLFRTPGPAPGSAFDAASGYRFAIRGVGPPGRFFFGPPAMPSPWRLQSVTIGGRDVTDAAFDLTGDDVTDVVVTYSDKPTTLSVKVTLPLSGESTVTAFVFPAARTRWPDARLSSRSFSLLRVPATGAVSWPSMLPGDYLVVAIDDALAGNWPDESLLAKLAAVATPVKVAPNQDATVTIKVSEIK